MTLTTHSEKIPTGETLVRPYSGKLISGPKILPIGPGSDPQMLQNLICRRMYPKAH